MKSRCVRRTGWGIFSRLPYPNHHMPKRWVLRYPDYCFSKPQLLFFFERVPHLIKFSNNRRASLRCRGRVEYQTCVSVAEWVLEKQQTFLQSHSLTLHDNRGKRLTHATKAGASAGWGASTETHTIYIYSVVFPATFPFLTQRSWAQRGQTIQQPALYNALYVKYTTKHKDKIYCLIFLQNVILYKSY